MPYKVNMSAIVFCYLSIVLAAGCSGKEQPVAAAETVFHARHAEFVPASKTILDGAKVSWSGGDEITILWEGGKTLSRTANSGQTATFTAAVDASDVYFAVYPSSVRTRLTGETVVLDVPAAQHGSFAEANIALGRTTAAAKSFHFRNLCALGRFTLSRNDISEISFFGNGSEALAGEVSVTLDASGIPLCAGASETTITLTPSSGPTFAPGTYYFAVCPQNLESGLSFSLAMSDGKTECCRTSGNIAHLQRSTVLDFGTLDDRTVSLADSGGAYYDIAYSGAGENAAGLADAIEDISGNRPSSYNVLSATHEKEILVGSSGRGEIEEALAGITGGGYRIGFFGSKLVIASTDDTWTAIALYEFEESVIRSRRYRNGTSLNVPEHIFVSENYDDEQLIARLLARGFTSFDLETQLVGTCPKRTGFTVPQGAASDGTYVYFTLKGNEDASTHDSDVKIYQYTLSPFAIVAESEVFNGHHANDITYDSLNKRLLVNHGTGASGTITAVSTEPGLGSPYTITTGLGIGGITYNALRNIYEITQGGTKYQTADDSFQMLRNFGRSDGMSASYTAQRMGSDDFYVYFPMSGQSDNILVVYDWEGRHIANLTIDLGYESESMFYAAGDYYVNFYSGGAKLYKIVPELYYTYSRRDEEVFSESDYEDVPAAAYLW